MMLDVFDSINQSKIEKDIAEYKAQLDVLNMMLVSSIRAGIYREKDKLDIDAAMWLHVLPKFWGTHNHIDSVRQHISETVSKLADAEMWLIEVDNAMHEAWHENLGECSYEYGDGLFTKPCKYDTK